MYLRRLNPRGFKRLSLSQCHDNSTFLMQAMQEFHGHESEGHGTPVDVTIRMPDGRNESPIIRDAAGNQSFPAP
jgi:hypothetical protein